MPALRWRLNYRLIELSGINPIGSVGVRRNDGTYDYRRWAGFIPVETAREWASEDLAMPVKLQVEAWSPGDDGTGPWHTLEPGQHVQGCLRCDGVYGVLADGDLRICSK